MSAAFQNFGSGNVVALGQNIEVTGYVNGHNNQVVIEDAEFNTQLRILVQGNHNRIHIGKNSEIKGLTICCGNHVKAHNVEIDIGDEFTIEHGGRFFLYNSGNVLKIGSQCMFSNNITIRCGESPHLLFHKDSGAYLDVSEGVFIGNHVWVGESAYITKAVTIGDECVVGACSVVTKRFDISHAALAGNPARVVRQDVQWIRNPGCFEEASIYKDAYLAHIEAHSAACAEPL